MKPVDVLVLNNIGGGFDILVKRLPNPHETIMMKQMRLTEDLAKGGNVAVALARLGVSCAIIGKIGDDEAGKRDLGWMQAAGVDTGEVLVSPDVATGQGIGIIAENGDNILITGESSSEKLTWEEVQAAMLRRRGAGYFITGLEVRMPLVLRAIQLAKQLGMRVMFNPSPVPEGGLPAPLHDVDDFFVNEVEAQLLLGLPAAEIDAARALPARPCVPHAGRQRQLLPGRAAILFYAARARHCSGQLRRRRRLPCRRGSKPGVGQAAAAGLPLGCGLFRLCCYAARVPARLCQPGHCGSISGRTWRRLKACFAAAPAALASPF